MAITHAQLNSIEAQLDRFDEARRKAKQVTAQNVLAGYEGKMIAELARIFKKQSRAVIRALQRRRAGLFETQEDDVNKLIDNAIADSSSDMFDVIERYAKIAVMLGGKTVIRAFNADLVFSLTNPRAVEYIRNNAADMITKIDDLTRTDIRRIILAGVENGTSYAEVARQIKTKYQRYAAGVPQQHIRSRAELIAVTELGNGYAAGAEAGAYQLVASGIKIEKQWLSVGDRRVSPGCRTNSNAGWIALDADFPSGHSRPLRFPGCRCTAQYRRAR
jgi:uncharacterized protein with gpF-like domain